MRHFRSIIAQLIVMCFYPGSEILCFPSPNIVEFCSQSHVKHVLTPMLLLLLLDVQLYVVKDFIHAFSWAYIELHVWDALGRFGQHSRS